MVTAELIMVVDNKEDINGTAGEGEDNEMTSHDDWKDAEVSVKCTRAFCKYELLPRN